MTPDQADHIISLLEEIRDRLPKPKPRPLLRGDAALPRAVRVPKNARPFQF